MNIRKKRIRDFYERFIKKIVKTICLHYLGSYDKVALSPQLGLYIVQLRVSSYSRFHSESVSFVSLRMSM